MANHHATVVIEDPDGHQHTYSGPGESIGTVTSQDVLRSAEIAALADSPKGSTVTDSWLT